MSRELDEACAKAMGEQPLRRWTGAFETRKWSKDAALIPRMLAWLTNLGVLRTQHNRYRDDAVRADLNPFDETGLFPQEEEAPTLSEAIAKLVVAVGDAKRSAE